MLTVTGDGLQQNKDFYVRGKFSAIDPNALPKVGPFGGISFNMPDTDNGNYVMMRLQYSLISLLQEIQNLTEFNRI